MPNECPDLPVSLIDRVKAAVPSALDALLIRPSGCPPELDETTAQTLCEALSWISRNKGAVESVIALLPRDALVVLYSVGKRAFLNLLARTLEDGNYDSMLRNYVESETRRRGISPRHRPSDYIQDLRTDLLVRADKSLPDFDDSGKFDAYLRRALKNKVKTPPGGGRDAEEPPDGLAGLSVKALESLETPSEIAMANDPKERTRRALIRWKSKLDSLEPRKRAVFLLKHYHEWSFPELAKLFVAPEAGGEVSDEKGLARDPEEKLKASEARRKSVARMYEKAEQEAKQMFVEAWLELSKYLDPLPSAPEPEPEVH